MDNNPENRIPGAGQFGQSAPGAGNGGFYTQPQPQPSPSVIYNNMQNGGIPYGGAPQYHYGPAVPVMNGRYYFEQQQRARSIREAKKAIRRGATPAAAGMGLYWVMGMIFSAVLIQTRLGLLYNYDSLAFSAIGVFYTAATVFLPFLLAAFIYKKCGSIGNITLDKPKTPPLKTLLLIIMAFGGCMLANYITNILVAVAEGIGIYFDSPTGPDPTNAVEIIVSFIGTAIMPPLIEEFAMRGVVLGNLRKYGDSFAIIASAFVFGMFHANPTQIPFAFMCGLLLGYVAVETGSLWVSITVHLLVNSLSCIYPVIALISSEETADSVISVLIPVVMLAGVIALALLLYFYRPVKKQKKEELLSLGAKFGAFITNPGVLIMSIIFFIEACVGYVSFQSGSF